MKKFVYLLCFAVVVCSFYLVRKMHLHNFIKGKIELEKLYRYEVNNVTSPKELPKFIYVAHAGGGFRGKTYLNTIEAIDNSYNLGVDFIEVDINYTKDSIEALAHDFINKPASEFLKDKTTGTHLLLKDLLLWLNDKAVFVITDIKANNLKILQDIKNRFPAQSARIIPQVYTISEIIEAKKMGYRNIIFTNYISLYPNSIIKNLSRTNSLFAITLPYDYNFKTFEYFGGLKEMKTPIFTHTINDPEIISGLLHEGCRGVYTDFLLTSSD